MILCVSGDTHGALDRLYADVDEFERALGVRLPRPGRRSASSATTTRG